MANDGAREQSLRLTLRTIIFEAGSPAGKAFDVVLIASILLSVLAVMLDSVQSIRAEYGRALYLVEWFFTILFTIEYVLRLITIGRPRKYATSFFGIVDLLAILPTYISIFVPGTHCLLIIRVLRVLRVFRVLKFFQYIWEASALMRALKASRRKITVFLFAVLTLEVILGSLMYLVEGDENGFTSIPRSVYWAIVTLTTVGYGDISPQTTVGQFLAAIIMITGYSIIAVPTGIVTVELSRHARREVDIQVCPGCGTEGHDADALHCKHCGTRLEKDARA
jgi:voltage-gated potassium channel